MEMITNGETNSTFVNIGTNPDQIWLCISAVYKCLQIRLVFGCCMEKQPKQTEILPLMIIAERQNSFLAFFSFYLFFSFNQLFNAYESKHNKNRT